MTSKLEYLQRYLAKPGDASGSTSGARPDKVKKAKKEKGSRNATAPGAPTALRIRDLSDALPQSRVREKENRGPLARMGVTGDDDEAEVEYVDEKLVEEAQKSSVETSGIRWKISQHRKGAKPSGAASNRAVIAAKEEDSNDDDLSPPRAPEPRRPAAVAAAPAAKASARQRNDSDADISPPRPAQPKKARHDSDSDISPPRPAIATKAEDSDDDISPPRPRAQRPAGAAAAPAAKPADSDDDISPPRPGQGVKTEMSDDDLSPPRAGKQAAGKARHDSDSDISAPRREPEEEKMSSGLSAGLVQGAALKAEAAEVREKRKAALLAAPDEETGKNAQTVYRSRDLTSKITREEWAGDQVKKKKKRLKDYPEQELQWGGGLKQQQNKEEEEEELQRIAAQPFARYEPDQKYMEELKDKQDWNDPMRKHMDDDEVEQKAASRSNGQATAGARSGAAVAAAAAKRPKCPHPPWLNRFGIKPGYRWDGKVRTNGFETRWLNAKNHREFKQRDAWMWDELNS